MESVMKCIALPPVVVAASAIGSYSGMNRIK
jgi:hypothetical protein